MHVPFNVCSCVACIRSPFRFDTLVTVSRSIYRRTVKSSETFDRLSLSFSFVQKHARKTDTAAMKVDNEVRTMQRRFAFPFSTRTDDRSVVQQSCGGALEPREESDRNEITSEVGRSGCRPALKGTFGVD